MADATSPEMLWGVTLGGTLALLALPWLGRTPRALPAKVSPERCNGCGRCFADCPFTAVTLAPRADGRSSQVAVVDGDLCAACGICVGACPSSTPFGRARTAAIDLPQAPLAQVRTALEDTLAQWRAAAAPTPRIVVFGCAPLPAFADAHTAMIPLVCAGQLPPALVEYAVRAGADGVMVTGCRDGDCDFRFGNRWVDARIAGTREPHLRDTVQPHRVRHAWIGRGAERALRLEVDRFRKSLIEHPS